LGALSEIRSTHQPRWQAARGRPAVLFLPGRRPARSW